MHSPVNCSKVLAVDIALICQKARYKCTQNSYSIKVELHFTDPNISLSCGSRHLPKHLGAHALSQNHMIFTRLYLT